MNILLPLFSKLSVLSCSGKVPLLGTEAFHERMGPEGKASFSRQRTALDLKGL